MPSGVPEAPSAEQIARYGHIAAVIRAYMTKEEISAVDFAKRVGFNSARMTQIYKWTGSKAAPGGKIRGKIAKLLGVPQDSLRPRTPGTEIAVLTEAVNAVTPRRTGPANDILQFHIGADGEARIKVDATLPVRQALPLLRIILDAGILAGGAKLKEE